MLRFPSLDTLQLALSSGIIPPGVASAPASAAFEERGTVWVRPSKAPARLVLAELRRLGVETGAKTARAAHEPVECWPQLLPLRRDPSFAIPTAGTPVLFELDPAEAPDLIGEILRLGNDRQSLRQLEDGPGERVLLRVVGPPYYALLRALDRGGHENGPTAYVESAPRVWVEIGYTHPLVERLQAPPGQLLFLRAPRRWTFQAESKFRDVYEILELRVPASPVRWRDVEPSRRLTVPLRLARGDSNDVAELWVVRDRTDEQLEALVRHTDNRLLGRLSFAIGNEGDRSVVVLRVRPSKLAPPVLVLVGEAYRSYLRLPNLFLPVGTRVHPPLRRDAVARLLVSDPSRVTWLAPGPDGSFVPESLPDEAFRPLDQWIDYVLDREHQSLEAWIQSSRFDFEAFVCRDDQETGNDPVPRSDRSRPQRPDAGRQRDVVQAREAGPKPEQPSQRYAVDTLPIAEPSEALRRLSALEAEFVRLDAPLDADERQVLWRDMAVCNASLERFGDATVCWANALWELADPAPAWLEAWSAAESRAAGPSKTLESGARLDALLAEPNPVSASLRLLATSLISAAHGATSLSGLSERLDRMQHFWAVHEARVPIRVAWLTWVALARLSKGDALMLARARDRMLERLHERGLTRDLDLPGFLQTSAGASGDRIRQNGDRLLRLRESARDWIGRGSLGAPHTEAIADLMFAYGLARLGETSACSTLLKESLDRLARQDPVLSWLGKAFEFRIDRALEGKPAAEPLPAPLLKSLETLERVQRYKVDRLREHSQILEPHERVNPYRHWHGSLADEVAKELGQIVDLTDRAELATRMTKLLSLPNQEYQTERRDARVLSTALGVAFRLGEAFARGLFGRVLPLVNQLDDLGVQALLLERGLHLAAHFDQMNHVRAYVARFVELLDEAGAGVAANLEPVLGQCFRGLRKLGMRDEMGLLLERMADLILREVDLSALSAVESRSRARKLQLLLHVAAGWFYFGQAERALPVLDQVESALFAGDLAPVEQTALACGYIRALGLAPVSLALPRLEGLFKRLERVHDTFTTNSHYSLSRLDVIEAVVLTLISDDFLLDEAGRRWIEDDEYLVRRRIHRDVRAALGDSV